MSDDPAELERRLVALEAELKAGLERERTLSETLARQQEATERLRESEDRFRALVGAGFEGLTVSVNGRIVESNDLTASMVGLTREQLIGKQVLDLATPESGARVLENIRKGVETPYEITAVRVDGTTFPAEVIGRNTVYMGKPARVTAFRDITLRKKEEEERRRLEERMLHAQRLEQLGVLAGGIAHDFNNLALVVLGHAELGLAGANDPEQRHHFEQIRVAMSAASDLTKQMLAYAGRALTARESVNFSTLVREMTDLLAASVKRHGKLELDIARPNLIVEGDRGQLRQIIMNLITNASDSLGETGGRIHVRLGERFVTQEELARARVNATTGPGPYVFLEVEDTGSGMDAETQEKMFDPFFTTKFSGRGLGLASVLGIVRGHRGAVMVDSTPGKGTRIAVLLPRTSPEVRTSPPAARTAKKERILVVDDQPMIRGLIREYLHTLGFDVVLAENGRAALALFEANPNDIDLIVLDMMMPGMGGAEALPLFRTRRPEIPVVLLSGFFNAELPRETGDLRTVFLPKPFQTSELAAQVRKLLG